MIWSPFPAPQACTSEHTIHRRLAILLAFGIFVLSPSSTVAAEPADLVLRGGRVVTMDASCPMAEAVAVIGDRITAVGKSSDIAAQMFPRRASWS